MSIDEFLEKLPKDGWKITRSGIRRDWPGHWYQCPVSALAGKDASFPCSSGRELGISGLDVRAIVAAADNQVTHPDFRRDLRARLLAACGLQEQV